MTNKMTIGEFHQRRVPFILNENKNLYTGDKGEDHLTIFKRVNSIPNNPLSTEEIKEYKILERFSNTVRGYIWNNSVYLYIGAYENISGAIIPEFNFNEKVKTVAINFLLVNEIIRRNFKSISPFDKIYMGCETLYTTEANAFGTIYPPIQQLELVYNFTSEFDTFSPSLTYRFHSVRAKDWQYFIENDEENEYQTLYNFNPEFLYNLNLTRLKLIDDTVHDFTIIDINLLIAAGIIKIQD